MKYTKQELLKLATKNLIVNKEVAKLAKTKTMTRRLKTNLKAGDVFWLREPAMITSTNIEESRASYNHINLEFNYKYLADNISNLMLAPFRFVHNYDNHPSFSKEWLYNNKGVPNGCIKEMSRHFYEVISVHRERLQDITYGDIIKEGYPFKVDLHHRILLHKAKDAIHKQELEILNWWIKTWNSTAKAPNRWEENPKVEAIKYKELEYTK